MCQALCEAIEMQTLRRHGRALIMMIRGRKTKNQNASSTSKEIGECAVTREGTSEMEFLEALTKCKRLQKVFQVKGKPELGRMKLDSE